MTIDDVMFFNMDSDWSVQIREGLSEFIVNGVHGRGVCEILKRFVVSLHANELYTFGRGNANTSNTERDKIPGRRLS